MKVVASLKSAVKTARSSNAKASCVSFASNVATINDKVKTMPRIIGKDIPDNKQVWISLTYITGIGRTTALKLCEASGVDPMKAASN